MIFKKLRTHVYCDLYLDTHYKFNKKTPLWIRKLFIMRRNLDDSMIRHEVRRLNYLYFLNTSYWHTIADYLKKKAKYKCKKCHKKFTKKTRNMLNVHHKDYENHGAEHIKFMQDTDLIVVCSKCHKKLHNIKHQEKREKIIKKT